MSCDGGCSCGGGAISNGILGSKNARVCSCIIRLIERSEGKGGRFGDLGGASSRSSKKGFGDFGGDPNSSIGSSFGNLGGDGDLDR